MRWLMWVMVSGCTTQASGVPDKAWTFKQPDVSGHDSVADGRLFFMRTWERGDPLLRSDRPLGARNDSSCVACHSQGGVGGSGSNEHNVTTTRQTDTVSLSPPMGSHPVFVETVGIIRNTPALFWVGQLDQITDEQLRTLAGTHYPQHPEVTGEVSEATSGEAARFGWKGQTATVQKFVRDACRVEVGLRPGRRWGSQSDRREAQQARLQLMRMPLDTVLFGRRSGAVEPPTDEPLRPTMDEAARLSQMFVAELDAIQVQSMVAYVAALPAPTVPSLSTFQARGRQVFDEVGCDTCHTPSIGDVHGVFSDLLLHDMGDRLADPEGASLGYGRMPLIRSNAHSGIEEELPNTANLNEWRTPPLWGVADSSAYLHDGRATTLSRAIHLHGGEASRIRRAFERRPQPDKDALLAFLGALRSPVMEQAQEDACIDTDAMADASPD